MIRYQTQRVNTDDPKSPYFEWLLNEPHLAGKDGTPVIEGDNWTSKADDAPDLGAEVAQRWALLIPGASFVRFGDAPEEEVKDFNAEERERKAKALTEHVAKLPREERIALGLATAEDIAAIERETEPVEVGFMLTADEPEEEPRHPAIEATRERMAKLREASAIEKARPAPPPAKVETAEESEARREKALAEEEVEEVQNAKRKEESKASKAAAEERRVAKAKAEADAKTTRAAAQRIAQEARSVALREQRMAGRRR